MAAVIAAVAIIVVGGATAIWYLRSVRRRPTSVTSDVDRFRRALDALSPGGDGREEDRGDTMGKSNGAEDEPRPPA